MAPTVGAWLFSFVLGFCLFVCLFVCFNLGVELWRTLRNVQPFSEVEMITPLRVNDGYDISCSC